MSIRTKMVLVFSVMSAIILLIASMAGYFFAKNRFSENIKKQMTAAINAHVNRIDGWLAGKKKVVEIISGTIQAAADNGTELILPIAYRRKQTAGRLSGRKSPLLPASVSMLGKCGGSSPGRGSSIIIKSNAAGDRLGK